MGASCSSSGGKTYDLPDANKVLSKAKRTTDEMFFKTIISIVKTWCSAVASGNASTSLNLPVPVQSRWVSSVLECNATSLKLQIYPGSEGALQDLQNRLARRNFVSSANSIAADGTANITIRLQVVTPAEYL